jgi:hypothetical protein
MADQHGRFICVLPDVGCHWGLKMWNQGGHDMCECYGSCRCHCIPVQDRDSQLADETLPPSSELVSVRSYKSRAAAD